MSTNSAISSASWGIQQNLRQFDDAAANIAKSPFGPEVVRDLVQMKFAKHAVAANVRVLQTADQVLGQVVDIIA